MLNKRHWDRHKNGGLSFTEIGFGTAPLGNLYKSISDEDAHATLNLAWDLGLRYFDTAPLYGLGLSETRLNRFLRGKPRDEYILSTKVGRLMRPCSSQDRTGPCKWFDVPQRQEHYDYSYDGVMRSFEFSFGINQPGKHQLGKHAPNIWAAGTREAILILKTKVSNNIPNTNY